MRHPAAQTTPCVLATPTTAQPLNRSPVRILAHGNVLGKSFVVAVDERLGVPVSEFAPPKLKS